jgi:hypothetical protein
MDAVPTVVGQSDAGGDVVAYKRFVATAAVFPAAVFSAVLLLSGFVRLQFLSRLPLVAHTASLARHGVSRQTAHTRETFGIKS